MRFHQQLDEALGQSLEDLFNRFEIRPWRGLHRMEQAGKGVTMKSLLWEFNEILVERTGRPDPGGRAWRMRPAELLNSWFASDRDIHNRMEGLFREFRKRGTTCVETINGEQVILPILVLFEGCDHFWRRTSRTNGNSAYEHRLVTLFESFRNPAGHLAKLPLIPIAIWSEQFNNPHVLGDGP